MLKQLQFLVLLGNFKINFINIDSCYKIQVRSKIIHDLIQVNQERFNNVLN